MKKTEYTATFEMPKEDAGRIINDILGDNYEGEQRLMNERAIQDAVSHVCEIVDFNSINPKAHDDVKHLAAAMYMYGFHRAFEYYMLGMDVFNLESDNNEPQ